MIVALLIFGSLVYLALMAGKLVLAFSYAANEEVEESGLADRKAVVLQAILSGDAALETMLESNLLSLPEQQFVWLCDADDAEGIRVTDVLMEKYSGHRISRVLCPPCPPEVNPKVFKLMLAEEMIDEPFVMVLDDDTHLPADTAASLVMHAGKADIATGLPHYSDGENFSSSLLAQFVNNNSAMTYLSALPMMPPVSINGMCYAMRRESMGLFDGIKHHLTDDLALAIAMLKRGGTIHQSAKSQRIETTVNGMAHYFRMMHRWYLFAWLLIREQPAHVRFLIMGLHGWHPLLLWMILMVAIAFPSWLGWMVLAGFFAVRSMLLVMMQRRLLGESLHRPLVSLLSELLQPFHLLHALLDRRIDWRGKKYRVFESDRFERHA